MNRRSWLTSLLALPLIPSMLRVASEPKSVPGGMELVLHEQAATGYSYSCVSHNTNTLSVDWLQKKHE